MCRANSNISWLALESLIYDLTPSLVTGGYKNLARLTSKSDSSKNCKILFLFCVFQRFEVHFVEFSSVFKKNNTPAELPSKKLQKRSYQLKTRSRQSFLSSFCFWIQSSCAYGSLCNSGSHAIFSGSCGSGKMILLQFRVLALRCAKATPQNVVVVVSIKVFFSQNSISREKVDVL